MADDLHYSSNKRKFDDHGVISPPATRRATGFSAPLVSPPSNSGAEPPSTTYGGAPPPPDGIELAKQRAQEIAARLFNKAKAEYGNNSTISSDYSQKSLSQPIMSHVGMTPPSSVATHGYQSSSKKIEIPNGRVGVIIGKGGETIKYLQSQSGAKIQITRDADADPYSQTRLVEIIGNSEQINKAEQLINDVFSQADAGGSGILAARKVGNVPYGAEQFVMKVPNNRVGLIIGKGGESIKNMQAKSGARIQIIPLHLPPGDMSQERTVQIDGTKEQIEAAKQLVYEVTSGENFVAFLLVPKIILEWGEDATADVEWDSLSSVNRMRNQPLSGGYSQQAYQQPRQPTWGPPGAPQMQQPGYGYMQPPGAYPSQPQYGAYPSYPDQSSNQVPQQTSAATTGYDYYGQQPPVGGSAAPTDNTSYSYGQQQGYGQENYSGGYQSQQGHAYPSKDGSGPTYAAATQAGPPQAAPSQEGPTPVQASSTQGYNGQQQSSTTGSYPSQPGYGSQVPPASYGQPPINQVGYGYGQQPQAQSGYGQAPPSSIYGSQLAYGQQPSYGAAYSQPQAYSTDNAGRGAYDAPASPAVPTGVAKASPQS